MSVSRSNPILYDDTFKVLHLEHGKLDSVRSMPASSPLKVAYEYWISKCDGDQLPLRSAIDPIAMGRILANIMLVECLGDGDYLYRVVGTRIVETVGTDVTNKRLSECAHIAQINRVREAYGEVIERRQARFEVQRGLWLRREWIIQQRLLMPLRREDDEIEYILGCISTEKYESPGPVIGSR
jgi:hypothetical protein